MWKRKWKSIRGEEKNNWWNRARGFRKEKDEGEEWANEKNIKKKKIKDEKEKIITAIVP